MMSHEDRKHFGDWNALLAKKIEASAAILAEAHEGGYGDTLIAFIECTLAMDRELWAYWDFKIRKHDYEAESISNEILNASKKGKSKKP